jgi:DNA polymerase elongation subunit (family B)
MTQGDKVPNPESDEIVAVFFAFHVAGIEVSRSGVLGQNTPHLSNHRLRTFKMEIFDDELDLLNGVVDLVIELDPDILTGWDVQLNSWGFLEGRARTHGTSGYRFKKNELTEPRPFFFGFAIPCTSKATVRECCRPVGFSQGIYFQSRRTPCSEFMANHAL